MFKVLVEGCKPKKATKLSAAIDLFAAEDVVIPAGDSTKVRLGVCIDEDFLRQLFTTQNNSLHKEEFDKFMSSHYLQLEPRSSLRAKGLIAGTGIIDLDFVYPNEICIILHNPIQYIDKTIDINKNEDYIEIDYLGSPTPREDGIKVKYSSSFKINKGEKIAQIMLCEHKSFLMGYESETERQGGFGHSGK